MTFTLGGIDVDARNELLIIAEAGVNHDGDPATAHALVEAAGRVGADVVKFQTFDPESLVSEEAPTAPYQRGERQKRQSDLLRSLTLPVEVWRDLRDHSLDRGIDFISTPFDLASAKLLVELGVPALKLSSGELTNLVLLESVADLGVPLLISTGMSTMKEVDAAMAATSLAPSRALLHCVSAYPAPASDANLRVLPDMWRRYAVPLGWSDHTHGLECGIGAVALGATILEKHLTLDRNRPGPDHSSSADPGQFSAYVHSARTMFAAMGDGNKRRMPSEEDNAPLVRRSWHARMDLRRGTRLSPDHIVALRPEVGLAANVPVTGRVLRVDVAKGSALVPDMLERTEEGAEL